MEEILERQLPIFEVQLLQHFRQLRKLSRAERKAFAGRMRPVGRILCKPGLNRHNYAQLL